ncbi:Response regulator rcp1 [Acaryochloris thomasi RCC1774]|uniref:Response regulator rcp1 n=1 Tax=Acaryochloris thomasi RCC1774 TaxID=1764569 RepID=A0A2W1K2X6_9CYAN|nr:response regulator [Acaryochloris thomasi]PZD74367.1 Response regulator rcp1 [Acaryochloris thomasi RCC1774]
MSEQPIQILLVEDNPGDAFLVSHALEQRPATVLHQVSHGREALDFLKQAAQLPDLMLLDLNLPQIDGYEVLRQVKADPDLMHIPVIVLSTSGAEQDILRCYRLQANCYLTKPLNLQDSATLMLALEQFWLVGAALPRLPGTSGSKTQC